jgi:hypothetical protein
LTDAYLTIAREYGFASWARLNTYVKQGERSNLGLPHQERIQDSPSVGPWTFWTTAISKD